MKLIEIIDGVPVQPEFRMAEPVNLCIEDGEQIAILGDNAAGKTRLVEIMLGSRRLRGDAIHYDFSPSDKPYISDNIKYIAFRDSYGPADASYYMQQRWNQMDIDPETPTLGQMLARTESTLVEGSEERRRYDRLIDMFQLKPLMDKYIISLSSGELRKYMLTKLLARIPRMLIIDNPYIGLDAQTRAQISELFAQLVRESSLTLVLVLAREAEVPPFITHVIPVEGMRVGEKRSFGLRPQDDAGHVHYDASHDDAERPCHSERERRISPPEILKFTDVTISYGSRTILSHLDWTVRRGEHWALTGENGSGKSTLLSLVCADNPQGYACNLEIFGRRRGSGESIWDIKKHIGYVSPEMHRAYTRAVPALEIVASGMFDTVGLHRRADAQQMDRSRAWMERFGIGPLAERGFMTLSSGEQRLCLVARAFVKEPDLLILDEPMHGLDEGRREMVRRIIDEYCSDPQRTLVMVTHYPEELPSCIDHHLKLEKTLS